MRKPVDLKAKRMEITEKTKIIDFGRFYKKNLPEIAKIMKEHEGKAEILVHPFFSSGGLSSPKDRKLVTAYNKRLKKADKPLIVMAEDKNYKNLKELFEGFNLKQPVIFIRTENEDGIYQFTEKENEKKNSVRVPKKLMGDPQMMRWVYRKLDSNRLSVRKSVRREMKRDLLEMGVKDADYYGEKYYPVGWSRFGGCVYHVGRALKAGGKRIKHRKINKLTFETSKTY